jgi:hypothetical protein
MTTPIRKTAVKKSAVPVSPSVITPPSVKTDGVSTGTKTPPPSNTTLGKIRAAGARLLAVFGIKS